MKTLYCFGDSNTWGYDPGSFFGEPYLENARWTCIIEKNTDFHVINDGMNGRCIPESRMQAESIANCINKYYSDDLFIWIMLGTNDFLNNPEKGAVYVAERMDRFLSYLLDGLKNFSNGFDPAKICLISPARVKKGTWVESESLVIASGQLGGLMREVAEKHGTDFIDAGCFEIPLAYDGVHFSEEGHKVFAEKMTDYLSKYDS